MHRDYKTASLEKNDRTITTRNMFLKPGQKYWSTDEHVIVASQSKLAKNIWVWWTGYQQ